MKKILFITNSNLLPNTNGAVIYSLSLIKYLEKLGNNITLINFFQDKPNNENEIDELKEYCEEIIQIKLTRANYWKNISLLYPITIKKYYRKDMINRLKKLVSDKSYDIAIYDHLHMAIYQKHIKCEKHILVEHNVETDIWRSYLQLSKLMYKPLIYLYLIFMSKYERKALNQIKNVISISDENAKRLKELSNKIKVYIFKPMVQCERINNERDILKTKNAIIFVGSYSWFPNQEAARFLAKKVMAQLRLKKRDIKLYLVGNNPTLEMYQYAKDYYDIIVTGQVDSIDPYINSADIFINAIESGSGLNIKLVEAMGKGIPIISSKFGVRGFEVTNNQELVIYKNLDNLTNEIVNLIENPMQRLKLSNEALKYYNKIMAQDNVLKELLL